MTQLLGDTSVHTCLVGGRVGRAYFLKKEPAVKLGTDDGLVTTSQQRPLQLAACDKDRSHLDHLHHHQHNIHCRKDRSGEKHVDADVAFTTHLVSLSSPLPPLPSSPPNDNFSRTSCDFAPDLKVPRQIQQVCTLVKDQAWTLVVELSSSWISGSYQLGKEWESMGIRSRFQVIDTIINLFLLTPLSVLFCYGIWGILDRLLLDYLPIVGCWFLFFGAIATETSIGYFQERIRETIPKVVDDHAPVNYEANILLCNFIIAFANVCHIRACTDLLNFYVGSSAFNSFRAAITALVILWGLKCGRNIICTPFTLGLDNDHNNYCKVRSLNGIEADLSTASLIDHLVTQAIVHTWVHLHWTGVWNLLDCFFFPLRPAVDVILTWSIGCVLTLGFILSQTRANEVSQSFLDEGKPMQRTLFENFWYFSANIATILVWRATWMFFDGLGYYFPIYHAGRDMTCFYASAVAFILMAACHASASLTFLGCEKDGEGGICFSNEYFGEFFKEEIEKIEQQEQRSASKEASPARNGVVMRKKQSISAAEAEVKAKKRTSLEDVVKADYRKKEAKAKKSN